MGVSEQQEAALRELLEQRTPAEWDPKARELERALGEGRALDLTAADYERLLAAVIRLRLRRALTRALKAGAINAPAAAQVLGFVGHSRQTVALEDLLNRDKFPNLASGDFAFLREVKKGLAEDVRRLQAAAGE